MRRIPFVTLAVGTLLVAVLCVLQVGRCQSRSKYWVYFSDKGPLAPVHGTLAKQSPAYQDAASFVQPRALARRAKVLPRDQLMDYADVSVNQNYIRRIIDLGGTPIVQSRWLNAASFLLSDEQAKRASQLPMVVGVAPVKSVHGKKSNRGNQNLDTSPFAKAASLDYGLSEAQVDAINIPQLHNIGVTGKNVIVGMLDSGFRWRAHESLYTRHVIAEHDFIFNRDTVSNGPRDSSDQDEHGTLTFSTLAGYMPGKLIGPAFDASFILAKTEWVPGEDFSGEEDYWAAGIEWEESLGADVVSSSVGYNTFSDADGYTWENGDFNGRTSVTAKAAVRAARLGVVVCTGIGNEGNGDGVTGTMLTPGDADSIISVGALKLNRTLASFSSTGPTNDGRIKPDIVAPGANIYCANHAGFSSYFYQQGVSVASPLTSGSAALILSVRPELTPMQVINAIRSTADRALADSRWSSFPNNFVGWGLVNAYDAALSFGPIFSNSPTIRSDASSNTVSTYVMSKFGINPDSVIVHYDRFSDSTYSQYPMILESSVRFPTSGLYSVDLPPGVIGTRMKFFIEARDSAGHVYRSPAPALDTVWSFTYGGTPLPPLIPTLSLPANRALNQSTALTLIWNAVTSVERYRLQVATDTNFINIIVNDSTLTTSSRLVTKLVSNTTYYWRVNAKNAGGESGYSDKWSFTTSLSSYHLTQNFPNPFNPSTTITTLAFDTPFPAHTDIVIYNVLGQHVRTLFSGLSTSGGNTIVWNGKDDHGNLLPSGVYLCRMVTPTVVLTTRMMILR